jgi:copper oxidase (laccase) domain-containing protein
VSAAPFDDGMGGGGLNLGLHVKDDPDAVRENRERLQALLPGRPAWIAQVHGADVVDAKLVRPARPCRPATPASLSTVAWSARS